MKKYLILVTLFLSNCIALNISYAAKPTMATLISANKITPNLPTALADLKKKTNIAVIFPKAIPQDDGIKQYYANIELPQKPVYYHYLINIDATPDCNGASVCNFGYLRAKQGGKPEVFRDGDNQVITVVVSLANHIQGYFTPGHAMGSFFPALLEWQKDGVLYSLSWKIPPAQEESSLIEMANTAILGH